MKTSAILAFAFALVMSVSSSEIHAFYQNDAVWFVEKAEENDMGIVKRRCTRCVGHHGKCTIGEGNCYAPDGCYFCGGCNSNQARRQDPHSSEGCQCY